MSDPMAVRVERTLCAAGAGAGGVEVVCGVLGLQVAWPAGGHLPDLL